MHFRGSPASALNVKPVTVAQGISIPWAIEALPNGDLLITERSGILYLLRNNSTSLTKITGLPKIDANGQGGLLDLELHPDFANNQWLYITYSSSEGDGAGSNTALMRAKLSNDHSQLREQQQLYKGEHNSKKASTTAAVLCLITKIMCIFRLAIAAREILTHKI